LASPVDGHAAEAETEISRESHPRATDNGLTKEQLSWRMCSRDGTSSSGAVNGGCHIRDNCGTCLRGNMDPRTLSGLEVQNSHHKPREKPGLRAKPALERDLGPMGTMFRWAWCEFGIGSGRSVIAVAQRSGLREKQCEWICSKIPLLVELKVDLLSQLGQTEALLKMDMVYISRS